MGPTWNRSEAAASVAHRLWMYLSPAAERMEVAGIVEGLWDLAPGDLRRLTAAHVALHPDTAAMLDAAGRVLRMLPSSVTPARVELVGAVRGPVDWTRTQIRQRQTGDPTRFICSPPERRYDTALGRLVLLALTKCEQIIDASDMAHGGARAEELVSLRDHAARLKRHSKLSEVTLVRSLSEATMRSLSRFPGVRPLVDFLRTVREAVEDLDQEQVTRALSSATLVPSKDDRLFELMVGFAILDHLDNGPSHPSLHLLPDRSGVVATIPGDPGLRMYWQRSPWAVLKAVDPMSTYHQVLKQARLRQSSLRPDLVITTRKRNHLLMVECKHTAVGDTTADRAGITDALAYLHDTQHLLKSLMGPKALVVAWGSEATPSTKSDVVVSNHEDVGVAIDLVLQAWLATERQEPQDFLLPKAARALSWP